MPYKLLKAETEPGYFVETEMTGAKHSNKPLSKAMATRQMRALYLKSNEARGGAASFDHASGRPGIFRGTRHRLLETGNPLRPEQHFTSLYTMNSVCTQFPTNK